MKLENYQILNINNVLQDLINEKLVGSFRFKLYHNKMKLEEVINPIIESVREEEDEDERLKIMHTEQVINIIPFTEQEIYDVPLSVVQLMELKPILEGDNNDEV